MIEAIDYVLKHSRATSAPLQAVLLVLANYTDKNGIAYPGIPTIARESRMQPRQAKRSIRQLEAIGAVQVERRHGRGNRYRLRLREDTIAIPLIAGGVAHDTSVVHATGVISGPKPVSYTTPDPLRTVKSFAARSKPRSQKARPEEAAISRERNDPKSALPVVDMQLLGVYAELFKATHAGDAPHIDYPRDRKMLRDLLQQHPTTTVEKALRSMFRSRDPWVIKAGHTLTFFRREYNRFLGDEKVTPGEAVREIPDATAWRRGCQHSPACRSVFEHEAKTEAQRASA